VELDDHCLIARKLNGSFVLVREKLSEGSSRAIRAIIVSENNSSAMHPRVKESKAIERALVEIRVKMHEAERPVRDRLSGGWKIPHVKQDFVEAREVRFDPLQICLELAGMEESVVLTHGRSPSKVSNK
jgi:hypothetical protein